MIRLAKQHDLDAIERIYDAIHTNEENGLTTIGWIRGVYPTRSTAETAICAGEMYVMEEDGFVVACGKINHFQDECYQEGSWQYPAPPARVLVLHTLVVDPTKAHKGCGTEFLRYYEACAAQLGCAALRLDTNARNTAARAFYEKHGYKEVGIVPCEFNGIAGVNLVLLEKPL